MVEPKSSLSKLVCNDLPYVLQQAYGSDSSSTLCHAVSENNLADQVTIQSAPDHVKIFYTGSDGNGVLRLFSNGQVFDGAIAKQPAFTIGATAGTVLVRAMMGTFESPGTTNATPTDEAVLTGAIQLLRCRTQGKSTCLAERLQLQHAVQLKQNEATRAAAAAAEQQRLATERTNTALANAARQSAYGSAVEIWRNIDSFIAEAQRRDDRDSDLDTLRAIVARYATVRPVSEPSTLEGANQVYAMAQQMKHEFESNPALKSLVNDEGDCSFTGPGSSGGKCTEGTVYASCKLGTYSFEHSYTKYCPETEEEVRRSLRALMREMTP